MYRYKNSIAQAVVLGIAAQFAGIAGAQAASSDDARIEALEQQIRVLQETLTAQQEQLRGLSASAARTRAASAGADIVTPRTNGRTLTFTNAQGDYSFQVGGLFQADATFFDEDDVVLGNGTELRRAFLEMRGTAFRNWNYRLQYDFARPAGGDPASRGLRDAWIQYTGLGPVRVTIGSFKVPFGFERLGSNLIPTYLERGVTDLFSPDRHIGVGLSGNGTKWSASAGVFGERPESDVGAEGDEGWDLGGRFTFAPVNDVGRLVHVGAAVRYHEPRDSTNEIRFRTRPGANVTGARLIDTNVIAAVENFASLGLEAAVVYGPVELHGEYVVTSLNRTGALADVDLDAFYASASWFITGESRPYRVADGVFDRITPKTTVGFGGIGAWEVGVRYNQADLTDENIIGGVQDDVTFALNWYPTPNLRMSANYVKVLDIDRPGNIADGDDPDAIAVRAQVDF